MQENAPTVNETTAPQSPPPPAGLPPYARPTSGMNPMHSKTESTLAPTSEFTRLLLLALVSRYVFRGALGLAFAKKVDAATTAGKGIGGWIEKARVSILNTAGFGGRFIQRKLFPKVPLDELEAATYTGALGLGSGALTLQYSQMVRNDIMNMFSESVGYEFGKSPDTVTFQDIERSQNMIVKATVKNYRDKMSERLLVDGLFVGAIPFRNGHLADLLLGVKGAQALSETWKRKSTMFEDLVTFVNNKINPRNGLGQPVTVGEIFDLYQHYNEQFNPQRMFSNVVERGTGEGAVWADSQVIFKRVAELMNLTYAYKHENLLDAQGQVIPQANFPLPKFVYMLGHDLIDTRNPKTTLAYIEVANRYGMEAVKDMQTELAKGTTLESLLERYPVVEKNIVAATQAPVSESPNSITKGNHPDQALDTPRSTISTHELRNAEVIAPEAAHIATL
ncbi:MAG: hypothetical protein J0M34_07815 [Alphaproteobacteria bacterium]|nr:hypothetical protein [Alphaproteobacteria bacterium]